MSRKEERMNEEDKKEKRVIVQARSAKRAGVFAVRQPVSR